MFKFLGMLFFIQIGVQAPICKNNTKKHTKKDENHNIHMYRFFKTTKTLVCEPRQKLT